MKSKIFQIGIILFLCLFFVMTIIGNGSDFLNYFYHFIIHISLFCFGYSYPQSSLLRTLFLITTFCMSLYCFGFLINIYKYNNNSIRPYILMFVVSIFVLIIYLKKWHK
jgi:hypothetical protein